MNSAYLISFARQSAKPQEILKTIYKNWSFCNPTGSDLTELTAHLALARNYASLSSVLTPDDFSAFDRLSDVLQVYQYAEDPSFKGVSWTMDRRISEEFIARYLRARFEHPKVLTGKVLKKDILLPIFDRRESTIILNASSVVTAPY